MLGNQIAKVLSKNLSVTEANRSGVSVVAGNNVLKIDAQNLESIEQAFSRNKKYDYVINCIGNIKQLITTTPESIQNAIQINSIFPHLLDGLSIKYGFKVLQICTDCVYSGITGGSSELSSHDSDEIYGKTKSLGEVTSPNTMNIRCSIVGREMNSSTSLLEWFLSQNSNSEIRGFTNHHWNGVTTFHFGRVIRGIILNHGFVPGKFHLIPANHVSKFELLSIFAEKYSRRDVKIEPFEANPKIDRTLSTVFQEMNLKLWSDAGYSSIPTIQTMIGELQHHNETEEFHG